MRVGSVLREASMTTLERMGSLLGLRRRPGGVGVEVYPWTSLNAYYMLSTETSIGMGGGG